MQASISKSLVITTGLAIFAMQFGAGNIVFALSVGQYAQDKNLFATLGLLLSGVVVPLLGLIAMTLYQGDYKSFFARIGKFPGLLLTILMLSLLGPVGAIPRCIALAYSTSSPYLPSIPLHVYSMICCICIYFLTFRRTQILDIIGYFLTPFKLGSLLFLIICGIYTAVSLPISPHDGLTIFFKGFTDGYQTMDLLGAFFICSVVLDCLRKNQYDADPKNSSTLVTATLKACCIGSALLALIYIGFSYTAAYHSRHLGDTSPEDLVSKISLTVLGAYGGLFVCFAVTMACLTTAIALSTVFAEFLHKDVSKGSISYPVSLLITLLITYFVSTMNFTGIMKMLTPILYLFYPALIMLCILNILHKLYQFQPVKIPMLIVFGASLCRYFI